jgi:hypothetical protein
LAPSIEAALTSIGVDRLEDAMEKVSDYLEFSETPELKLIVRKFKKEKLKKDEGHFFTPDELDKQEFVPDAYITGEHWYTSAVIPDEVEVLWLTSWTQCEIENIIPYVIRKK